MIISGLANAGLNLLLVIVFDMGVAGVAIGTVVSQFISCVLVLRCLHHSEGSYQLRFSKLTIKSFYLKQIFQVGVPAGIQSTVINLSNALLQSSVNSFGSTAMAGYTAANNIFGFLYISVNSITQSCMSFTSQNYGVRKTKRMDKILIDCIILSFVFSFTLGCGAYFFGNELLRLYTSDPNTCLYNSAVFLLRTDGSVSGCTSWNGSFRCAYDPFYHWYCRNKNCMDLRTFSVPQIPVIFVYFLPCILDSDNPYAGNLFLFCQRKSTQNDIICR